MNIAVIPARGGSKRIPQKNIRLFAGKPLVAYSIDAAKKSNLFNIIAVSTDDEKIAAIARQAGATHIIERPSSLSDDIVGTTPVVQHALSELLCLGGEVDYVCCIYATAPMLQPDYLCQGLERLKSQPDKLYAFSVTSFEFPILRSIKLSQGGGVEAAFPESIGKRSQDLDEYYHDAGQFYWGRRDAFLSPKGMFKPHSIPIVLPRYLVQDIDTPEDWERAELMYEAYVKKYEQ